MVNSRASSAKIVSRSWDDVSWGASTPKGLFSFSTAPCRQPIVVIIGSGCINTGRHQDYEFFDQVEHGNNKGSNPCNMGAPRFEYRLRFTDP